MIIKDVRITLLRAPYKEQPALQKGYDRPREILVVEIETKSGPHLAIIDSHTPNS